MWWVDTESKHICTDFIVWVFDIDINMQIFATILLNRYMFLLTPEINYTFRTLLTFPCHFFLNGVALVNLTFELSE